LIHVDATTDKELKAKKTAEVNAAKAEAAKAAAEAAPAVEAKPVEVVKTAAVAVAAVATPVVEAVKPAETVVAEDNKPALAIVALTDDVKALIEKIKVDAAALEVPAKALDNKFDARGAKANWNTAVKLIKGDLEALKGLSKQDVAEGSDFDVALAGALAATKDLGVVVSDKFKLDEKQTIQNLKAKTEKGL
jgi:hypothetical protein